MKKKLFSIITALALCLALLPGTAWAAETPADGGDITTTGIYFNPSYAPNTMPPMVQTVYRAGNGTVTWIPTVEGEGEDQKITHGQFIFENTTFDLPKERPVSISDTFTSTDWAYVIRYGISASKNFVGDVDIVLKGTNTVTGVHDTNSFISCSRHTAEDIDPKVKIVGEEDSRLDFTYTGDSGREYPCNIINIKNDLTLENVTLNCKNSAIYVENGSISIKNSRIKMLLEDKGFSSYKYALWATRTDAGKISFVTDSVIDVTTKTKGISFGGYSQFANSEITVCSPGADGLSTSWQKMENCKLKIYNAGDAILNIQAGLGSVPLDNEVWVETGKNIYTGGTVTTSPEQSEKELRVHKNGVLTITNDAAFNTVLENGAVLTAAKVKNLTANGGPAKISLTDGVYSMTVSGYIGAQNSGSFSLEYTGTEPKALAIFTAQTPEDAAKITFTDTRFERKDNQIVWKQTPLAIPTGMSWDGAKAKWTAVENAQGYTVQLYKGGETYGEPVAVTSAAEYDFTSQITETGSYTFKVKAMGGDSILNADSEYSTASESYEYIAPVKYTVTFNTQGGTPVDSQTVVDGKTSARPADPTRSGYTFSGWYKEAECTTAWDFENDTVTGNIILYAKWTVKSSSGGGGGSSRPSLPVTTDKTTEGGVSTTDTTAKPSATVKGDTASATVSGALGSEIVKQAEQNKSDNVVIAPEIKGDVAKTEVSIPASTVGEIGSRTQASLTISTPVADVTIPNGGLASLASEGGTISVTAEVKGDTVELTVTADGETVQSVPGGMTVTVPAEGTKPGTVAVLLHEDGTQEVIRKSVAGEASVTIPLDGSAKLEIVDNSKTFADVPDSHWASDAVAFASARELFRGTAPDTFSPSLPMSRGMLAVVLHNLENNPAQTLTGAFADVDDGHWYAEGVAWATSQGIVSGYGDRMFGPNDNITREQLAVMLWRYAGSPAAAGKELHFTDADRASGWALEALRWAVENGVINGKGGGILDPQGLATRAEAAQMLMNFLKK